MIEIESLPTGVMIGGNGDTGPSVEISTPACGASISLRGGHVLSWQPANCMPVLWLSPAAVFHEGKAIRGGIPVCWPWFGDHPADPNKPSHGFARIREWDLVDVSQGRDGIRVSMALPAIDADLKFWPSKSRPKLTIIAGQELTLILENTNIDAETIEITQALHTYFAIGDIEVIEIEGLQDETYHDKVTDSDDHRQIGAVRFDREVDRIYRHATADIDICDPQYSRRIRVRQHGGSSIVVWNPWIEKTRRLGDMGPDDSYCRMVCVETGSVADQAIKLAPGETHRLKTTISVESL